MSVAKFSMNLPKRNHSEAILGATRAAAESRMSRRMSKIGVGLLEHIPQRSAPKEEEPTTITDFELGRGVSEWELSLGAVEALDVPPVETEDHNAPRTLHEVHFKSEENVVRAIGILGATPAASEARTSRRISAAAAHDVHHMHYNPLGEADTTEAHEGEEEEQPHRRSRAMSEKFADAHYKHLLKKIGLAEAKKSEAWNDQWRPKRCMIRYTTPWPMPDTKGPLVDEDTSRIVEEPEVHVPKVKLPWCGLCMRESFDPYHLPCGHSFCRRCIMDIYYILRKDHAKAIADTRAVMRCPLKCCNAVIPCLPLINGNFRFHKVQPGDKVQVKDVSLTPCEQYRLKTYKVRLDVDFTIRKSDNLFDGYDDVVIIP